MNKRDHQEVQRLLDGDMTSEEFAAFQQRMRGEPGLMKFYGDYALLHHTLSEEFEGAAVLGNATAPSSRGGFGLKWLLAAAACVAAGLLFWFRPWSGRSAVEDVAVASFSVDAIWRIDGASRNLGGATGLAGGSVLILGQGRASVSLEPSVTAVIEGPAELAVTSPDALHLARGRGFFQCGGARGRLTVTTPEFTVVDAGTEFGIESFPDKPDELHVRAGRVSLAPITGGAPVEITAGDAARGATGGTLERVASDGRRFPTSLGRFHTVMGGEFRKDQWHVDYGNPSITPTRVDGANYAIFHKFSVPQPADGNTVLLVSLDTGKPAEGEFHTDGWAGMSFFSGGNEMLFFGDSFGTKSTWSLDVKQRMPVVLPEQAVLGPRAVTLRYDALSGDVTLHDGGVPLKPPFCRGKLPPGLRFDEIRIGASAGAGFALNALQVRAGGD